MENVLSNIYGIDDSYMPVFHTNTNQEKFIYYIFEGRDKVFSKVYKMTWKEFAQAQLIIETSKTIYT